MTMTGTDVISFTPGSAGTEKRVDVVLEAYKEVCASYHGIDEFRAKLLGILPVASIAGILVLGNDIPLESDIRIQHLVGFGCFFASAFTLALFLFEVRGIVRCHHLIERGRLLETEMGVTGQFTVCQMQHAVATVSLTERIFNAKVAASAMYSLVFAAWLFLALHFSFGITIIGCGLTATIAGGVLAFGTHRMLTRHIPA